MMYISSYKCKLSHANNADLVETAFLEFPRILNLTGFS